MLLARCERVDLLGATEALSYDLRLAKNVDAKNSDWVFSGIILTIVVVLLMQFAQALLVNLDYGYIVLTSILLLISIRSW